MKPLFFLIPLIILFTLGCEPKKPTAQELVDQSFEVCGSANWKVKSSSFDFREHHYESGFEEGVKVLKRTFQNDTTVITDILKGSHFERYINANLVALPDSMAQAYSNSVNSVHYFARLPFGLNDKAVNKEFLGETTILSQPYYKVKVTFDQQGGGEDFEDVYVYWFNKQTLKPDYLAYSYQVNGGGVRFRAAFNERYVGGIRFVDYKNYKPVKEVSVVELDRAFEDNELELLSNIIIENIVVN